jgi:hypothetical protein
MLCVEVGAQADFNVARNGPQGCGLTGGTNVDRTRSRLLRWNACRSRCGATTMSVAFVLPLVRSRQVASGQRMLDSARLAGAPMIIRHWQDSRT